jgi:hypothetical protein
VAVFVNQYVLRLDVPVHNAISVHFLNR